MRDELRKAIWEWLALALAAGYIIFFGTAPLHPLISRLVMTPPPSEQVYVNFTPETRGSHGDYDRWRRTSIDRR